jgi:hypothetical protein
LDSVSTQRKAKHVLVNSAYTSQMDSTTGLLQGKGAFQSDVALLGCDIQIPPNPPFSKGGE